MYEATVSVEKSNLHLLDYVKQRLLPVICEADGITSEADAKFRSYFSVACADNYRFQVQRALNDVCTQALTLGYKNVFVRKSLKLGNNFCQNVLVNTICLFDNEYDKQAVSRILKGNDLFLDGYYNFRLDAVKRKWSEIVKLVADNIYVASDCKLITEFLQYLLESGTSKLKTLSVSIDGDDFYLFDSADKAIDPIRSLAKRASCEEEVMLNALWFKPQKIKIYCMHEPSTDFKNMLDALFDVEYISVN